MFEGVSEVFIADGRVERTALIPETVEAFLSFLDLS